MAVSMVGTGGRRRGEVSGVRVEMTGGGRWRGQRSGGEEREREREGETEKDRGEKKWQR